MRPFLLCLLLSLAAPTLSAQLRQSDPAFAPALSPWVGIASFGTRQAAGNTSASYRGSFSLGARGELPLTQRVGLMANVGLSPFSRQRTENPVVTELHEKVLIFRADAALAWRFIPRAPVFFFGGGGVLAASKPAFPDFDESILEPRALFGLGYDRPSGGRWNFRLSATGFITMPAEPDAANWSGASAPPAVTAESTVFDWAVELGARYRLRGGS
jgi:hypothetical protein